MITSEHGFCPICGVVERDCGHHGFRYDPYKPCEGGILERLSEESICEFEIIGNIVTIREGCDSYYMVPLSKSQFKQLIAELSELYDKIPQE